MQTTTEIVLCGNPVCGRPVPQKPGGHRRKLYCDNKGACRVAAFRTRDVQQRQREREANAQHHWEDLLPETRTLLQTVERVCGWNEAGRIAEVIRAEVSIASGQSQQATLDLVREQLAQVEQELATSKALATLTDRQQLQHQLLALGEKMNYPMLILSQTLQGGSDAWALFVDSADEEGLHSAIAVATYYYQSLVEVDEIAQVQRDRTRRERTKKSVGVP